MIKRVSGAFKRSSSSVPKTGGTEAKYLLVIPDDMTDDEKNWLNAYHQEVYAKLAPLIEPETAHWLAGATRSI